MPLKIGGRAPGVLHLFFQARGIQPAATLGESEMISTRSVAILTGETVEDLPTVREESPRPSMVARDGHSGCLAGRSLKSTPSPLGARSNEMDFRRTGRRHFSEIRDPSRQSLCRIGFRKN